VYVAAPDSVTRMKPQKSARASSPIAAPTAYERAMVALNPDMSSGRPDLRDAVLLIRNGQLDAAAQRTRAVLDSRPQDFEALFLFADIARRMRRYTEAESLFARCMELAPDVQVARFHHANMLLETGAPAGALAHADALLNREPENPVFLALKAMALELLDEPGAAALLWQQIVQEPSPGECRVRYAHLLRVLGRHDEAIAACREAIVQQPSFGRAWWALAQFSTFRFSDADIAEMETQVQRGGLSAGDRIPLLFALGKAFDQLKRYEKAFGFYARGNSLQRLETRHDPNVLTAYVQRCKRVFMPEFFGARDGFGQKSHDPIFLIGMTRAGSTLVEQILASHSQIEGTRELFNLGAIARDLQTQADGGPGAYPANLESLDADTLRQFGERYLETAQVHRKLGRPHFIDKMGHNFMHLGLLHLMLPNAKIVDVRRHPLACCFSNFTQLYANGQNETYRLSDMAQLYRDYVELMAHFDRVLPGRVHRVIYEQLVADPEGEIRRLVDYLELPFEQSCLEFHRNARAVSTVSSEQVRRPLYSDALEHWRHYEPWLGPLKAALGAIAETYPEAPPFIDPAI
jgi:tetratricopeptide (TPR) repeat protein